MLIDIARPATRDAGAAVMPRAVFVRIGVLAPSVAGRLHDAERAAKVLAALYCDLFGGPALVRQHVVAARHEPVGIRHVLDDVANQIIDRFGVAAERTLNVGYADMV